MKQLTIQTRTKNDLVEITHQVQQLVHQEGLEDGICALFNPHTTAGLTLNENWDRDVEHDMLLTLGDIAPPDARHQHGEGNSPAHLKTSLMGSGSMVFVKGGQLQMGRWQGIFLAEFDGPRRRQIWVKLIAG